MCITAPTFEAEKYITAFRIYITAPTFEAEKYITAFRIYITARSIHIATRKNLHHSPQYPHHDSQESTSQPENLPHRLSKISPMVKRASRHKKNAIFVINLRLPVTNDRLANLWVR